ncbi:MAG: SET domain-containing protein-lysine N-methyltransferase [Cytophagales bacterium]|nr:MAG: SET domain-containing protein-lysine N-methyltransferase [Cytophagales bacterium]
MFNFKTIISSSSQGNQPAEKLRNSPSSVSSFYNPKISKQFIAADFYGIFANSDIEIGEIIFKNWNDSCAIKTRADVDNMSPTYKAFFEKYCTEIEENIYVGPYENEHIEAQLDYFINHSCDPNAWMVNDGDVAARRKILKGEQITIDYATFVVNEFESAKINPCLCGSYNCRGEVGKNDWWQLRDVYKGHYISWIQNKIDNKLLNGGV